MDRQSPLGTQALFRLELPTTAFPFRRELSLAPLVAAWERMAAEPGIAGEVARTVCRALERAPELRAPIEDPSTLERHRDLVEVLMSLVFPAASWEKDYGAAAVPFQLRAVHATPSFRRLLLDEQGFVQGWLNMDAEDAARGRLLYAYDAILRAHYGMTLDMDYPFILATRDPESGLERHFRIQLDTRFLEVRPLAPLPDLDAEVRRRLLQGGAAPELMGGLFPPDTFAFSGFTVLRATEVTDQEVLSAIQRDLIDKESIVSTERFQELQDKLRTLLRRPDLRLGLAAFQDGRVFVLNYSCEMEHGCIFADTEHLRMSDFTGSVYERAVSQGTPLVVDDLAAEPRRTRFEDALLTQQGIRNVLVAPLHYQDRPIGTLDLSSPEPGRPRPREPDQAARGAAALLDGRPAKPRRAGGARPGGDQGEVHRDPSLGGVALPARRPRQHRGARAGKRRSSSRSSSGTSTRCTRRPTSAGRPSSATSRRRPTSGSTSAWPSRWSRPPATTRPLPILDETGYRIERHAEARSRRRSPRGTR